MSGGNEKQFHYYYLILPREVWEIIFKKCSVHSRKNLFELSRYFYNLFLDYIYESSLNGKWLDEGGELSISQIIMKKNKIMPQLFINNVFERFLLSTDEPYFFAYSNKEYQKLCINFLVCFSTKKWLMENKEKIFERIEMNLKSELKENVLIATKEQGWGKIQFLMFLWMEHPNFHLNWTEFLDIYGK